MANCLRNSLKSMLGILRTQRQELYLRTALFSTSSNLQLREIVKKKEGNTIVVEGKQVESPKTKNVIKFPESEKACTYCRLDLDVKYTDVLILAQFLREDGCLLPRRVTGVCKKSQSKLAKLVRQAQRAGLLANFKPILKRRKGLMSNYKWKKFPSYYTDDE